MSETSQEINNLAERVSGMLVATSPSKVNGVRRFVYFYPRNRMDIDEIMHDLRQLGMPAETHMSGLNNKEFPLIRVPLSDAVVLGHFGMPIDALNTSLVAKWRENAKISQKDVEKLAVNISEISPYERRTDMLSFVPRSARAAREAAAVFAKYGYDTDRGNGATYVVHDDSKFVNSPKISLLVELYNQVKDKIEKSPLIYTKKAKDEEKAAALRRGAAKAEKKSFFARVKSLFGGKENA